MIDYININKIFIANLLTTVLGFINTLLIGHYYGIGQGVSAYFAASVMFVSLSKITQTGTISEYFFNTYFNTKKEFGIEQAYQQYSILCNWLLLLTALLILLGLLFAGTIIKYTVSGFDNATQQEALYLFRVLIFALPLQIIGSVFQSLLNSEKIYGRAEMAVAASMAASIIILIIWGSTQNTMLLVITTYVGSIFQVFVIIRLLKKINYKHSFIFKSTTFGFKNLFSGFTYTSIYVFAVTLMTMTLTNALSTLPKGTFAIFKYVENIYSRISTLVLRPIGLSFFTDINELITADSPKIKLAISENLNFSYFVGIGVFAISILTGYNLVHILWIGQGLTATDLSNANILFQAYCFLLIVMGVNQVYRKLAISAVNPAYLYTWWIFQHFIISIVMIYIIPKYGFTSLVIIIMVHTFIFTIIPMAIIKIAKPKFFTLYSSQYFLKVTLAACVAFMAVRSVNYMCNNSVIVQNTNVNLFFAAALFTVLFLAMGYFLKIKDVRILYSKIFLR